MKKFLKKHLSDIRMVKIVIAVLLGIMVVADIILVILADKDFPTFSYVVRDYRHKMIWFTFLFGGLVSKIFYNRVASERESEVTGLVAYFSIVVLLFVIGRQLTSPPTLLLQVLLLVCGGVVAYRAWPQYQRMAKKIKK